MKKNNIYKIFNLVLILLLSLSLSEMMAKDKKGWKILGQRAIKEGTAMNQIMIKEKKGKFRQLKIQVKKAPANLEKLIVHFNKDEKQVVWLKKTFKDGNWSRVIKVKGGKRVIQKVVIWSSNKELGDKKPVVFLWGRQ